MSRFDWTDFVVGGIRYRYNCKTRELRSPYWAMQLSQTTSGGLSSPDGQLIASEALAAAVHAADLKYKCEPPVSAGVSPAALKGV
jgi:hypothetical protein